MSTLRVDKIEPYLSSSIDIVGYTQAAGGATTGSNVFVGNQTVTGSIDITGQFLVNGTPITGSGGGSVNTASLATTGSNVFQGNQDINGTLAVTASGTEFKVNNDGTIDVTSTGGFNVIGSMTLVGGGLDVDGSVTASAFQTNDIQAGGSVLNISAGSGAILFMGGNKLEVSGSIDANGPIKLSNSIESTGKLLLKPDESDPRYLNVYNTAAQDTHITASGGYLYLGDDTTYVSVNNYGADYLVRIKADNGILISGSTQITGSVDITGDYKVNGVAISTSTIDTGSFATTGSNEFVGKQGVTGSFEVTGSSIFKGDTVISTIDSLPGGTPGQIAFQGGKMWVYISGQWNEVSFVAPAPSSYEYSMGYDASSQLGACGASPSNFYSDAATLVTGSALYTGPGLASAVSNGYYASASMVYEVTGGSGVIATITGCPIPYYYSPVGYDASDSGSACSDSSAEFYTPCSVVEIGCRLSPGSAMIGAVDNGFYALSGSWFEVTGGDGVISASGSCA
jgi:hypothetical protein